MSSELGYWAVVIIVCTGLLVGAVVGLVQDYVGYRRRKAAAAEHENRPTIEVVTLSLTPGAVFDQWCDDCSRTHAWMNLYAYEGDDPTTARPLITVPVPDEENQ